MRDPERIPDIIRALTALWEKNPDWRLGQLVNNLAGGDQETFYIEDDEMLATITDILVTGRWD